MAAHIREVPFADAERLHEIYAYYVENAAIAFEYGVPSVQDFFA